MKKKTKIISVKQIKLKQEIKPLFTSDKKCQNLNQPKNFKRFPNQQKFKNSV